MTDFNKIAYACKNTDEVVRLNSSSGGIFYKLCQNIINKNGIVFGAAFDNEWNVIHTCSDNLEGCQKFMGSKYVQSDIGNAFIKAKEFLDNEKIVLFSGTPCQIAGLKCFLGKDYDNLLTIDLVCHGVPSPYVWKKYLTESFDIENIEDIEFRNKANGWKNYSLNVKYKNKSNKTELYKDNPYIWGFITNIYLRPSCYACQFKGDGYRSDITLGDFWGIGNIFPDMDDDKGVSAIVINTQAGKDLFNELKEIEKRECKLEDIIQKNKMYKQSSEITTKRKLFYSIKSKKITPKLKLLLKISNYIHH